MYDLYSAQLNDRFQKMLQMGLKVGGFQGPPIRTQSTVNDWMAARPTTVQGGPFGAPDLGPFQGLQKAAPAEVEAPAAPAAPKAPPAEEKPKVKK